MTLEDKLAGWTGPSSSTEQQKQDRTERMIREAIEQHPAFDDCTLRIYAKGSYANNTNVRADSDVDVAVQCQNVFYHNAEAPEAVPDLASYSGIWTPEKLRAELVVALGNTFSGQIDRTGSTAINIETNTSRVEADVVPSFDYRYYFSDGTYREGSRIFKKDKTPLNNFPDQQLENGRAKNNATSSRYKKTVRIMKRIENDMLESGYHRKVPSFFVECLLYNCPNSLFRKSSWAETIRGVIYYIWESLQGDEPVDDGARWLESSECKYLFHRSQPWTRRDGRDFVKAAWNYLGFS